jgi:hypothetical protein
MTPRQPGTTFQWSKVVTSAIALVLLTLIRAPDAGAGAASTASKTKFLALGTVGPSLRTCSNTTGCDAPEGRCECIEWDGPGQAQVAGFGKVGAVNVTLVINLDSCVQSPSIVFPNCCSVNGILQFFTEPGPVTFNFNLSDGTVCESPDEFNYKLAFQIQPSTASSDVMNSRTMPTSGEFEGMPVGQDNHFMFFMK